MVRLYRTEHVHHVRDDTIAIVKQVHLPQMSISVVMSVLFARARGDRVMSVGRVGNDVTKPSIGRATGPMGSSSRHRHVRHWKPSGSMTNDRLLWRALNTRQKKSFLELVVHLGSCKDHCDASRRCCLNIVSGVYNAIRYRIHGVNVRILRSLHLAERPAVLHLPGTQPDLECHADETGDAYATRIAHTRRSQAEFTILLGYVVCDFSERTHVH